MEITEPFYEYEWHDAYLKMIKVNRLDSGIDVDAITLTVEWPSGLEDSSGIENEVVFEDVFQANFNMNFFFSGVEYITVVEVKDEDPMLTEFNKIWPVKIPLRLYIIETGSGSKLKILAKSFKVI